MLCYKALAFYPVLSGLTQGFFSLSDELKPWPRLLRTLAYGGTLGTNINIHISSSGSIVSIQTLSYLSVAP